jgi:quercetin dioxygenase-like cupin family protein
MKMLIQYLDTDFRFENENGILVQLVHDGWKQVNVITSVAGKKRGGHYHKYNQEAFYVVSGSFRLLVWKDDVQEEYTMRQGDWFMIEPYVFHTFEYAEDTTLVSMYSNGVEMSETEKDIWTE